MQIKNKYVKINGGVVLHMIPSGVALLSNRPDKNSGRRVSLGYANGTAAKFLLKCDGSKTAETVIKEVHNEQHEDLTIENLMKNLAFFKKAEEQGHVDLLKKPLATNLETKVSGTPNFFVPVETVVELTYNCPFKCKHCYAEASPEQHDMIPTEKLLEKLEELRVLGVYTVELTGGEAMVHKDFTKILKFCVERFTLVSVLTNCFTLTNETEQVMKQYADKLIVSISLHSSTKEYHDWFTEYLGAFDTVIKNIKRIVACGVKTVRISTAVTPKNVYDIENIIKLARDLGATVFTHTPVMELGRAKNEPLVLTPEEAEKMILHINGLNDKYSDFIQIVEEHMVTHVSKYGCGAGVRSMVIDPLGNIRPCTMLPTSYFSTGNLFTDKVEDLFNGPTIDWLKQLKPPRDEVCWDCKYRLYCKNCIVRGITKWEKVLDDCRWARANDLEKWISSPVTEINKTGGK
ncbi:MAG: radical SAM protein [Nitrososphaerota archaeon]|jgi:radical SAM protein with 4Fe4S-binding SPASM domain|nr:radical SAM protein [Nitrososphaerota archaeon]